MTLHPEIAAVIAMAAELRTLRAENQRLLAELAEAGGELHSDEITEQERKET